MQPYQQYYPTQYQQNLQNQIQNLQNQQVQYQAMLNQQSMNQVPTMITNDFNSISVNNIPMDNNGALFIKSDRSEIVSKHWMPDGTVKTTLYLPQIENRVDNVSQEQIKGQNDAFNEFTDVFNDKINSLFNRLDTIEDLLSVKPTKRTAKKEVSADE